MTRPSRREIRNSEISTSLCLIVPSPVVDTMWLTRTGPIFESRTKDATTSMRSLWPRIEPVCCLQVRTWSPKGLMHILQEQSVRLWAWSSILGMAIRNPCRKKPDKTSGGQRVTDFCLECLDRKPNRFHEVHLLSLRRGHVRLWGFRQRIRKKLCEERKARSAGLTENRCAHCNANISTNRFSIVHSKTVSKSVWIDLSAHNSQTSFGELQQNMFTASQSMKSTYSYGLRVHCGTFEAASRRR